jgi:hypothetical protein
MLLVAATVAWAVPLLAMPASLIFAAATLWQAAPKAGA